MAVASGGEPGTGEDQRSGGPVVDLQPNFKTIQVWSKICGHLYGRKIKQCTSKYNLLRFPELHDDFFSRHASPLEDYVFVVVDARRFRDHSGTDSVRRKLPPLCVPVSPSPVSREASRDLWRSIGPSTMFVVNLRTSLSAHLLYPQIQYPI